MPLQNVEHEAVLVNRSPKPVSNAINARTHLVDMPPGTPTGFPVAQVFREEGSELNAPLAEGFVTHRNATLVKQFLHIPVTQGKAVVQPNGMLDDRHGKSVAVELDVGHGGSAYPDPVKATQPLRQHGSGNTVCPPHSERVQEDRFKRKAHRLTLLDQEDSLASGAFLVIRTRLMQDGTSLNDVARHLGHSALKTARIYAEWSEESLRQQLDNDKPPQTVRPGLYPSCFLGFKKYAGAATSLGMGSIVK